MRKALRDALLTLLAGALVGLVFNALRPAGLAWIAQRDYEILVPCPEPLGEAGVLEPARAAQPTAGALLVDGRTADLYRQWHLPQAINVPFDFLDPVSDEAVRKLARSGARLLIVYGDGDRPDSGQQLARELAGRGLKNVHFVRGGAPALRQVLKGGNP